MVDDQVEKFQLIGRELSTVQKSGECLLRRFAFQADQRADEAAEAAIKRASRLRTPALPKGSPSGGQRILRG
jgi:hypothetical protein